MEEPICFSDLNCSNPSQIVKLNVGGCKFTTTVATLTCVGASYFDALFSGRWKQHLTEVRSAGVNKLHVTCLSLYTPWQRHNSSNAPHLQQQQMHSSKHPICSEQQSRAGLKVQLREHTASQS